jgi:NAD(P)-dependent dehydrogenase (short-subunit alcohol dehydrogenase family)
MPVALVTGASKGLGAALTHALSARGWSVVVDARTAGDLHTATGGVRGVIAVPGDVSNPAHRNQLAAAVARQGRLDLLVNNASLLGPSPQPQLADYPLDVLRRVFEVDVVAPLALTQVVLPWLTISGGVVVNLSSDASVEPYAGWGGYGSAKAALDQLTAVLAVEHPELRIYSLDPGDMRTDMHQAAFPGDDISDRPEPATVVPALLRLLDDAPPSGRYRAAQLLAEVRA